MAPERRDAQNLRHDDGDDDADDVHREYEIRGMFREEHRSEERHDRQLRRACQKRRDENRREPVLFRVERTRTHDGRHAAAEADNQRHDALAREADTAHDRIHDESDARHISRTVEEGQHEEQCENERHEVDDVADTRDDTVCNQRFQPLGDARRFHRVFDPVGERSADPVADGICERLTNPREGDTEHQVENAEENRQRQDAVREHAVDLLRSRQPDVSDDNRLLHDLVDEIIAQLDELFVQLFGGKAALLEFRRLRLVLFNHRTRTVVRHDGRREDFDELLDALLAAANCLHDGHAQSLFELLDIDADALSFRLVLHVEVNEKRDALFEELHREEKVALDIRGVNDIDGEVGHRRLEVVDDDLLLRRARIDAVGAGQVDDCDHAILVVDDAHLLVNSDARPVADLLTHARQFVEYSRFSRVRVARQGDAHGAHQAPAPSLISVTSIFSASARRSARLYERSPIAIGSPIGADGSTLMRVPGISPIVIRRCLSSESPTLSTRRDIPVFPSFNVMLLTSIK